LVAVHHDAMDLSFSRRNALKPASLDLATLLARISATQAATPTARSQMQIDRSPAATSHADARVDVFGRPKLLAGQLQEASFAKMFSLRQPM